MNAPERTSTTASSSNVLHYTLGVRLLGCDDDSAVRDIHGRRVQAEHGSGRAAQAPGFGSLTAALREQVTVGVVDEHAHARAAEMLMVREDEMGEIKALFTSTGAQ